MHNYINKSGLTAALEDKYDAEYIGYWELPDGSGPFYCFYQDTPNEELGHSNYFTISIGSNNQVYIGNGSVLDGVELLGLLNTTSGEVIISRFRHDYVKFLDITGPAMVDGGLSYSRYCDTGDDIEKISVYMKDGILYNRSSQIKLIDKVYD